jgi:hypothetical protein
MAVKMHDAITLLIKLYLRERDMIRETYNDTILILIQHKQEQIRTSSKQLYHHQ